jgi:hypothetical protein
MKQTPTVRWLIQHRNHRGRGCLIWPFSRVNGYGNFGQTIDGKKVIFYAHRYMCELVNGPPPTPEHEAAHECGNGPGGCVHPEHVIWKTKSDNQRDRAFHGTKSNGPVGKLTEAAVEQIRALKGKKLQREIAEMFGISRANVSLIHLGKLWPAVRKHRRPAIAHSEST